MEKYFSEKRTLTACRAAVLLLAVGAASASHADEQRFYVDARVGTAYTSVSNSDLENGFARQGVDATVYSVDSHRTGYALLVGMTVADHLSAELGYLDLGKVELSFDTTATAIDLARVHPESGSGATLGLRYSYPLASGFSAQARAGLFAWSGDYSTHRGDTKVDHDTESHTDFYWGGGVSYALTDRIDVGLEYQRVEFTHYATGFLNAGVLWRFDWQ